MTTPKKTRAPRKAKTTAATAAADTSAQPQQTQAQILAGVEILPANGATAGTPPPVATAAPANGLFTARELSRVSTLAEEIISLRARSADLIERANMAALQVFNVATGEQPDGSHAPDILAGIDKTTDNGPAEMSFAAKALAYATKQRARAKLQAAQREFESLRDLAGLVDAPEIRVSLGSIEHAEETAHGLGSNVHGIGPDTDPDAGPASNLPRADALPAGESEDCPD